MKRVGVLGIVCLSTTASAGGAPPRLDVKGPKPTAAAFCPACRGADEAGDPDATIAPFADATALHRSRTGDDPTEDLSFALRVGDAWYLLEDVGTTMPGHGGNFAWERSRVAGGRLVITWQTSVGRFSHDDDTYAIVCGLSAAAAKSKPQPQPPVCYGPIQIGRSSFEDHIGKSAPVPGEVSYELTVAYDCDLTVVNDDLIVAAPAKRRTPDHAADTKFTPAPPHACDRLPASGKHHLVF